MACATRSRSSTDERNERSRRAIERIGATFEGVLRHHRPSKVAGEQGQLRNSAMFAIVDDDWPAVASAAACATRPPARVTTVGGAMDMLMVTAHPDPGSFCHAVSAAAKAGLERAGHHVTQLDLYAIGFEPAMGVDEHRAYMARVADARRGGPPARRAAALGDRPRVRVPDVVERTPGRAARLARAGVRSRAWRSTSTTSGKLRPGLTHIRRIIGISTYGSPWSYVKLVNDNGRRMLTRALRLNCGRRTSTTWLGLYSIDTTGDNERRAFLDRVGHTMANVK